MSMLLLKSTKFREITQQTTAIQKYTHKSGYLLSNMVIYHFYVHYFFERKWEKICGHLKYLCYATMFVHQWPVSG